jgi:streptogramin lyase
MTTGKHATGALAKLYGKFSRALLTVGALAVLIAPAQVVIGPTVTAQASGPDGVALTPVQQLGGTGVAGLYGWGAATLNDGSVLLGDYWNYQIQHYAKDGTFLGIVVSSANQGIGANQHESPYGIAVDPTNNDIYFGDVDGFRDVDKYDINGNFLFEVKGSPVFRYPARVVVAPDRSFWVADQYNNKMYHFDLTGHQLGTPWGGTGTGPGQFKQIRGFAMDSQGRFYITDNYNGRVEVMSQTGQFQFQFGSLGTAPGQFGNNPDTRGLVIDQTNGWVYVASAATGFVNKYDLNGNYILRWGGFGNQAGKFVGGPREMTIDGDGNIWVCDLGGFRCEKFNSSGGWLLTVPNPPAPPPNGLFNGPMGVAVDPSGNVWVMDRFNQRVQELTSSGAFVRAYGHRGGGTMGFNYPRGIAYSAFDNTVVVPDTDNHFIKKFDLFGKLIWSVGGFGTALGKFQNPNGVDVGPDGKIYVADTQGHRVQVLDSTGHPLYTFGSTGKGNGQFMFDRAIELDPSDNSLWVTDSVLGKVQHFTNSGTFLGSFGTLGTADNQFTRIIDVEVDQNFVYIADADANRIKIWTKTGNFVIAWGNGGSGLGGLFAPHGLDWGPNGHLYEAEQFGDRVQELTPTLLFSTNGASQITSPSPNSTVPFVSGTSINITGNSNEDAGVAAVNLTVRDELGGMYLQPDGTFKTAPATVPATLLNPGGQSSGWSLSFTAPWSSIFLVTATAVDTNSVSDPTPPMLQFWEQ